MLDVDDNFQIYLLTSLLLCNELPKTFRGFLWSENIRNGSRSNRIVDGTKDKIVSSNNGAKSKRPSVAAGPKSLIECSNREVFDAIVTDHCTSNQSTQHLFLLQETKEKEGCLYTYS